MGHRNRRQPEMLSGEPPFHVALPGLPSPAGAYSHAVRHGQHLWSCGLGPHDPLTGIVPEGIEAQTAQVLDNLDALLSSCGGALANVVQMRVYLAELQRDFSAYNQVYATRMPEPYPARTTVGAGLLGFLIEIDAMCVL